MIATRKLAGVDPARTTLLWTQAAGVLLLTPALPLVWRWPDFLIGVWLAMAGLGAFAASGHGLLILAHKFAPAPVLTPFSYTQLVWMIVSGALIFGDPPPAATLVGAALVVGCGPFSRCASGREAGRSRQRRTRPIDKTRDRSFRLGH